MIKIGKLRLGEIPSIALCVSDTEKKEAIKAAKADLIEIRLDTFKNLEINHVVSRIKDLKSLGFSLILTIRSKKEGGRRVLSEGKRLSLFSSLIRLVDAVDIELKSSIILKVICLAARHKKVLIASIHNFKTTPPDTILELAYKKARRFKADIFKIACYANNKEDLARLMLFTIRHKFDNIITISLGNKGSISRILFPFCGSLITYSYLSSSPQAPGQIPIKELQKQLGLYGVPPG